MRISYSFQKSITFLCGICLIFTSSAACMLLPDKQIRAELDKAAILFAGPGNLYIDSIAELPAGTTVQLLKRYGDFVQVDLSLDGHKTTGFLPSDLFAELANNLEPLNEDELPWQEMFSPACAPGDYNTATDTLILAAQPGNNFLSYESAAWSLDKPVRIKFDRLDFSGDSASGIKLLGALEGSVDPSLWWQGVTAMGFEIQQGRLVLKVSDGLSENGVYIQGIDLDPSQATELVFDQPEGKSFSIYDDKGKEIEHIDLAALGGVDLSKGLFPQKKFYFGFNIIGQSSLSLTGLSIATQPDGKWADLSDSESGLSELAQEHGLLVGNTFDLQRMIDRRYCQIMQRDFNLITIPEFATDGVPFWIGPGQYNYYLIDPIVDFAEKRGWKTLGSHLVWGDPSGIPDWLQNTDYTREEYIDLLKQHIQIVVGHYKEKVHFWSIANEMATRKYWKDNQRDTDSFHDFWYEKIGPDYVEMSFRWAKEVDPSAMLFFNDAMNAPPFDKDSTAINAMMLELVKNFKADDVPIDAVGMQMHLFGPASSQQIPSEVEFSDAIHKYSNLGVRIYITEMDVDLGSRSGSQSELYSLQAQVFRSVMDACISSGVCDVFNVWGISDGDSYLINPFFGNEPNADPLLFDRNFNPKPAYFALRNALAGVPVSQTEAAPTQNPSGAIVSNAPTANLDVLNSMIDDFDQPDLDGSYDTAKWKLSGISAQKLAVQSDGFLTITDSDAQSMGDVTLKSKELTAIGLVDPVFIEAALALDGESAAGSMGFALSTSISGSSTWFTGCAVERFSSQHQISCNDFLFPYKEGHTFELPKQQITPGSWHVFRVEIDPASMTITYFIDGSKIASHIPADATSLQKAKFNLSINTWKSSYNIPLIGRIAYLSFGKIE